MEYNRNKNNNTNQTSDKDNNQCKVYFTKIDNIVNEDNHIGNDIKNKSDFINGKFTLNRERYHYFAAMSCFRCECDRNKRNGFQFIAQI